jgi:branched-chain amino acid transport system permease protein
MPSAAMEVSKSAPWAIYGASLIACMYVMPGGAASLIARGRKLIIDRFR